MTYDIVDITSNAIGKEWSQFGGWYLQWLNIVINLTNGLSRNLEFS